MSAMENGTMYCKVSFFHCYINNHFSSVDKKLAALFLRNIENRYFKFKVSVIIVNKCNHKNPVLKIHTN